MWLDPYFFENKDGGITITANEVPILHGVVVNDVWFQQDIEICYTFHSIIVLLNQTLNDRSIGW